MNLNFKKEPPLKRKIILWTITGVVGVFLLFWQFSSIKKKAEEESFSLFPSFLEKEHLYEAEKQKKEIEDIYYSLKEEINKNMEISEEDAAEILVEKGLLSEEDAEEALKKEGEIFKIIEEVELTKEKNGGEKE